MQLLAALPRGFTTMVNLHITMQIKEVKMEREVYVSPETEIIEFETEDVMVISGPEVPIGG